MLRESFGDTAPVQRGEASVRRGTPEDVAHALTLTAAEHAGNALRMSIVGVEALLSLLPRVLADVPDAIARAACTVYRDVAPPDAFVAWAADQSILILDGPLGPTGDAVRIEVRHADEQHVDVAVWTSSRLFCSACERFALFVDGEPAARVLAATESIPVEVELEAAPTAADVRLGLDLSIPLLLVSSSGVRLGALDERQTFTRPRFSGLVVRTRVPLSWAHAVLSAESVELVVNNDRFLFRPGEHEEIGRFLAT